MRLYYPTIVVVMMDQLSKMWIVQNIPAYESWNIIGSLLRFSHVKNPVMAFGISVGDGLTFPSNLKSSS